MSELDTFVDSIRRKYELPGLVIAVHQERRPDVITVSGIKKIDEPGTAMAADGQFQFASCGKAVTAAIINNRIKAGQLSLGTKLSSPELSGMFASVQMDEQYKNITIADILTHRSGLPNMPIEMEWPVEKENLERLNHGFTLEGLKEVLSKPPASEQGKFEYSNTGYDLLGHIAA